MEYLGCIKIYITTIIMALPTKIYCIHLPCIMCIIVHVNHTTPTYGQALGASNFIILVVI